MVRWNWSASSTTAPIPRCPGHAKTKSPELEVTIALPKWAIGWDVFCWIGHRRCSRHWSISQIQAELWDDYGIKLSDDSLARYIRHYQVMLAARQQDPEALRRQYESVGEIILSIDGLQPEKGHETLYVVQGTDPEAGVVRRAVDLRDGGRGPTADHRRPRSGPNPWASRWPCGCRTGRTRS